MDARYHFKNRAKKLASSILLYLFALSIFGQSNNLSREQMVQDIDILFSTIEEVHLDMYTNYPKQQLEIDIERVKNELEPSGDIFYFYKQIAPLVTRLRDGHTGLFPPFDDLSDYDNVHLFPFSVKITYPDKEIRIQNDCMQAQNKIQAGAIITSINDIPANNIVQKMMDYIPGEADFYKTIGVELFFSQLLYILYRDSIFKIELNINPSFKIKNSRKT